MKVEELKEEIWYDALDTIKPNEEITKEEVTKEEVNKPKEKKVKKSKTPKYSPSFAKGILKLLVTIFNGSPNILWGILLVLTLQISMSHAAPSQQTWAATVLSSKKPGPHRIVYVVEEMESKTWIFNLDEFRQEAFSGLADSCHYISIKEEECIEHPASCQSSKLSAANFEKAMIENI